MGQPRYSWQQPYLEALAEIDPTRLIPKVSEAERAIGERLTEQPHREELKALHNAIVDLRSLVERSKRANKAGV